MARPPTLEQMLRVFPTGAFYDTIKYENVGFQKYRNTYDLARTERRCVSWPRNVFPGQETHTTVHTTVGTLPKRTNLARNSDPTRPSLRNEAGDHRLHDDASVCCGEHGGECGTRPAENYCAGRPRNLPGAGPSAAEHELQAGGALRDYIEGCARYLVVRLPSDTVPGRAAGDRRRCCCCEARRAG